MVALLRKRKEHEKEKEEEKEEGREREDLTDLMEKDEWSPHERGGEEEEEEMGLVGALPF